MPQPVVYNTLDIVQAYLAERGVASKAAERIGCSARTVRDRLKTEEGQSLLAQATAAMLEQYEVSARRVVGEAAAIAFSDLPRILRSAQNIDSLNELEAHDRAAISELVLEGGEVKRIKVHAKLSALQLLAEYVDLAGLGAGDTVGSRPELGGLTVIGPTSEANQSETQAQHRRAIPVPTKLD